MNRTKCFALSGVFTAMLAACGNMPETPLASNHQSQKQQASTAANTRAESADILKQMSLDDKVTLVSGVGMYISPDKQGEYDKVPGTAGYTFPIPDVGLKSIALADGPAGLRIWPERKGVDRTFYATAFPVASVVSSTWDKSMAQKVGESMGAEVKAYGVDVLLAPAMNIHRNPRGGRNFEYFSEDPVLSGNMAGSVVNGIESNGVGASIKHFVGNSQETNRMALDTVVSERALRELYLKGFRIAIEESNPWTVMSAYNWINGEKSSQNKQLLTDVLRKEWGYDGLVMTDWFAGDNPAAQLKAGNDLLMPGMPERTDMLKASLKNGEITEEELDINVKRILDLVLKSPSQQEYAYSDEPDLDAHAKVARKVAAEGVVLLKNDNEALPLSSDIRDVGAFGVTSYAFVAGGAGSGDVNEAYTVSLVQGLQNADIHVDEALESTYRDYREVEKKKLPEKSFFFELEKPIPEMPLDQKQLDEVVARTDMGLITLGRNSGEFVDRDLDGDFYLTDAEQRMVTQVTDAYHAVGKKVVAVLNVGNVVEMVSWRDKPDAIILPWQGGQEAGNALTDVLLGKVNPSGHLPTTFPVSYDDVPSSQQKRFPGFEKKDGEPIVIGGIEWGKPAKVWYEDGIFVGYRYYDTFGVDVAYPFGYGLSYTDFSMTSPVANSTLVDKPTIEVPVTVTNTGDVAGKEVVQLYVAQPKTELPKPKKELKTFAKTRTLAPGESQTVTLSVKRADLASFYPQRDAWVLDDGKYTFYVSTSVETASFTASLTIDDEAIVEKVIADLGPKEPLTEIQR